jgi:hypothetical protein
LPQLRADFAAALRDVAHVRAELVADGGNAIGRIQRMHLERREADHEARADEGALLAAVVVTQDVADVLAEIAPDALPELLHPVDVFLVHAVRVVGLTRARLELRDALVLRVVP